MTTAKKQPKAIWAYNPDGSLVGEPVDVDSFTDPDEVKQLVREGRIAYVNDKGERVQPNGEPIEAGPTLPGGGPVVVTDVPGEQRKAQAKTADKSA